MNSEAVKEIVLKVNGDYAERELKKIQQNIVKTQIRFKKRSFMSFLKPHTHPFGLDLKPKYNCFTQI